MTGFSMPACACPWCGYQMDAASSADGGDAAPSPGDISLCFACTSPLQFDANLRLVKISDKEVRDRLTQKEYAVLMEVRRAMLRTERINTERTHQ